MSETMNTPSTPSTPIVVIGGGHAAAQLCGALVEAGQGARVHLVCAEKELPYHRPPLSKAFLKGSDDTLQLLRGEPWYAEHGITLHLGDAALAINRSTQTVALQSGATLPYGYLVLATGTRARSLPQLPANLANVAVLRNAADARRLRALLNAASALTVLGGGFIGLEIAATARAAGKAVTVLESAPRLLMRSVSPEIAQHVLDTQRAAGVDVRLGASAGGFEVAGDRLAAITVDGQRHEVELLVLGIGPNTRWLAPPGCPAPTASSLTRRCALQTPTSWPWVTAPAFLSTAAGAACGWNRCRTPTTRPAQPWPP